MSIVEYRATRIVLALAVVLILTFSALVYLDSIVEPASPRQIELALAKCDRVFVTLQYSQSAENQVTMISDRDGIGRLIRLLALTRARSAENPGPLSLTPFVFVEGYRGDQRTVQFSLLMDYLIINSSGGYRYFVLATPDAYLTLTRPDSGTNVDAGRKKEDSQQILNY